MTTAADYGLLTACARRRAADLTRLAGQAEQIQRQITEAEAEIADLRERADLHAKVQGLLSSIGEKAQDSARATVERLATRALQGIFGEELSFRLVPGERAGQATLDMVIASDYPGGTVETPVLEARGGGMAAVVGYVLRLVEILLRPEIRSFLVLDESFAHVSAGYETRVAGFLREVADRAGVQHVLVTHSDAYAGYADQHVWLELGKDGVTVVHAGEDRQDPDSGDDPAAAAAGHDS